jgi:hypothetical protein
MPEVRIDGVLYVPVSEAHVDAKRIEHALVSQWAGQDWRDQYPDAPTYLRVIVTDDEDGSGQSISDFIAQVLGYDESGASPSAAKGSDG